MKKYILIIPILFLFVSLKGQNLNNIIKKDIIISNDTVVFDTLSIIPGTFSVITDKNRIPEKEYKLDFAKALLIFNPDVYPKYKNKVCHISYRVFPLNFSQKYYHKEKFTEDSTIKRENKFNINENYSTYSDNFGMLNTSGSISRGINFGNNQNSSVSSDFNLQINGKINPEIEISANITDSNLPLQADGSSQNLREFDKVFIRLKSKTSILTAGDYDLISKQSYFMKYNKKVKGICFSAKLNTSKFDVATKFNASISKGDFNKMYFSGQEGNQGPYRLNGKNGEQYIIILSGSEKIYLDGILLKRGNENDYIINYNTGELTFTSKRIITKDSRITAEFEYSQLNYVRFAYGNQTTFSNKNNTFFFNIFSEQDAKNNTVIQDLTDEQKLTFRNIGDDINSAYTYNVTRIDTFNRNEILYRKTDTTVNGNVYTGIYVYSIDSISAKYRANFSYVGKNKGNYIRVLNGANGKVFKWVSPENNIPQGEYEPVKLMISPKKKQMITAGAKGKFNETSSYYIETAITNYDKNTFSPLNDNDNFGSGIKANIEKNFIKKDTANSYLIFKVNYQFESKNFDAFEPYKPPEFNRDLNLSETNAGFNEHFINSGFTFYKNNFGKAGFATDILSRDKYYFGNRNDIFLNVKRSKFFADIDANRLTTKDTAKRSEFIRYKSKIEKQFAYVNFGIISSGEKNIFKQLTEDSLNSNSYRFNEFGTYLKTPDNSKHLLTLTYLNREDFLPAGNNLNYVSSSHNFKFSGNILKTKKQTISTRINYRELYVKDTALTNSKPEKTLAGRTDYSFRFFKNCFINTFSAEHTSGNETVNDFSYLEVQSGQGIFAWKDFNHNNIKELNEFVPANFSDEANYIRITLPSFEYRKVYNQSIYENFIFRPRNLIHSKTFFKKILSGFSNRLIYKLNRKILPVSDFYRIKIPDSLILSQNKSVKNKSELRLSKLRTYLLYTYQNTNTENILINGAENHQIKFNSFEIKKRFNFFMLANTYKTGYKSYSSEFFGENNYQIEYVENEASLTFEIDKKSRIKGVFKLENKNNKIGEEKLNSYTLSGEYRFSEINKGNFRVNFDFVNNKFEGVTGTSVSYEILKGLQNGKNILWSLKYNKKITKNLQIELSYNGRKTGKNKIIHTGGMSLRAFF